jgi:predicted Fe-Mo cluster-binding NifX family protein
MSKKIAITVQRAGALDEPMDSRFGRTPAFLLVEEDSEEVTGVNNPAATAAHGAGTAAAAVMAKQGVHAVISGRFGPKAYEALNALGVEMWMAPGGLTAREALEKYRAGGLQRMAVETFR